jgi:hypothetical protein
MKFGAVIHVDLLKEMLNHKNSYKYGSFQKSLIFLYLFSLCNDLLVIPLGFTMPIHQVITLFLIPKLFALNRENPLTSYVLKPLWLEWRYLLILVFFFGLLFPWEYMDFLRSFTQKALARGIISICRFFLEIFSVLVPLLLIVHYKVSFEKLFRYFSYIIIFTLSLAIVDYILGYPIKLILSDRLIEFRITGLNGEPRSFGKVMLIGFIICSYARSKFKGNSIYFLAQVCSLVGILLSSSASALFAFIVIVIPISLFFGKKQLFLIPAVFGILILSNFNSIVNTLVTSGVLTDKTLDKISMVTGEERVIDDVTSVSGGYVEPDAFKRFEIFDRAALNYLYDNPIYIIIGTGPNLISIPSSEYVNDYDRSTYGEVINSVPHTYLINVISRSGLVGLILVLLLFFVRLNKIFSEKKMLRDKQFFWQIFAVNILIFSSLYFFSIGLLIISLYVKTNAINHNTHIKLG